MAFGVLAYGAYIPRLRLSRRSIAEANAWLNPALKAQDKGERAICNWDEDAVTMAVEAARDALADRPREGFKALYLATTSAPFEDRQNAGIVAEALRMGAALNTMDVGASQRAVEPAIGVDDRFAAEPQSWDVAAEGCNADHDARPPYATSARPLLMAMTSRSTTRQRKPKRPAPSRQISVRMVSPG